MPTESNKQLGDLTRRQLLYYFVLPIILGSAFLLYGWHLKQLQMQAPVRLCMLRTLNISGGLIAGIGWLMLGLTAVAKAFDGHESGPMRWLRVLAGSLAGWAGLIVPFIVMVQLGNAYNCVEQTALLEHGRTARFRIDRCEYSPGKHGGSFHLYFIARDLNTGQHEFRLTGPNQQWVSALDSITIRYLPANPEIYESLEAGIRH